MLSLDRWQEVFETVRRHRLRTFLTGLSVAWGIFMLVILLGAGKGLRNGAESRFADDAINSIWVHSGRTSLPYHGHRPGRTVQLDNRDFTAVRDQIAGVDEITGRFYLQGEFTVTYRDRSSAFDVRAVHPAHRYLEKTLITEGRFINELDIEGDRKVAVIGDEVVKTLFRGADPMGAYIKIRKLPYRVVGVFDDVGGEGERKKIYIPISTAQATYNGKDRIHQLMFTVTAETLAESAGIERQVTELLAARHNFDAEDPRALRVRNGMEDFQKISDIFDWIAIFVWIVGAGTIVAGIVGVSNIMLISVKERTREFGVRKAVGATPWSIISLVLQEAVLLTAVAGYTGLVAGVALLELAARVLPDNDFVKNPEINFKVALIATGLLVLAGALAGFFPARRAARIKPMVALRND